MLNRILIVAGVLTLTVSMGTSTARAGWGCGFRWRGLQNGIYGSVWKNPTEAGARKLSLDICKEPPQPHKGCFIVGCRENVDTEEQAHAIWPLGSGKPVGCRGNATGC